MKKALTYHLIIVILFLFCNRNICYADPVDSILAKTVVANFYNSKSGKSATSLTLAYTEKSDTNIPVYYVYNVNEKDGFVIISADDAAIPILGYSFEGHYRTQDISPEFSYWMDIYKEQILSIKKKKLKPTSEIIQKWQFNNNMLNNYTTTNNPIIVSPLLQQISWNQSPLYNYLCPGSYPNQTVTGCVATAMGQIMKYWNYPAHGNGSTPTYTTTQTPSYIIPSVNLNSVTYDWSNMPTHLDGNSTNTQINEIAKLLYHCGASVMMNYGSSSSASVLSLFGSVSSETAFPLFFGYNPSTIEGKYRIFNLSNWTSILQNELDNGRPILYAGSNSEGGHAWVCDGYAEGDVFNMNWGWGGFLNGWYYIGLLNPTEDEYSLTTQQALIGIQPDCQIPDLAISQKSVSNTNPSPGNVITANCSEKNNGHQAAGANTIKLYLSNSSILNLSSAVYLGQIPVSSVAALSQTSLLNTQITIPVNTTSGQYWLFYFADANEDINECYENNNFATVILNITASSCSQPQNDGCTGNFSATQLNFSTTCNFFTSTSCGATSSGFNTCSGNADDDVFFKFTATTANATIKVSSTTGYDAVFQLLTGPCGTSMQSLGAGCINNTGMGGIETQSYSGLISGNTYFIRVWHAGTGWGSGNFSVCVYGNNCSVPGISTTLTPGNPSLPGQIINTTTPQLNWTLASGATKYVIRISKEPYGYNNIVYTSACVTPLLTIPTGILQNGSNYRWDVEALSACGSNCSSLSSDYYFTVSTATCTTPATQASNIIFPVIGSTQLTVGWTNGDGNRRIVKINTTNSFTAPVNGSSTNANSTYSGSGEQVIYDGSSGSAVVYGLSPSTNYCFRVYEANCSGNLSFYNTATGTNNPVCQSTSSGTCTIPTTQTSNISFFNVGTNSIALNWSNGNGTKRIVKINTVNTFTAPANGTDPAANSIYSGSGEQVVYNGTGNSITISGLAIGTNYCFRVYEANCTGTQILYNINTATNNPNCQSTSSSCGTLQTPLPLIGNQICPGPGFYNSSVMLNWTGTNSGRYDIEIRQYPYEPSNIVFTQYCISDTIRFINSTSLSAGKLYSWRVRSTADCNNCIGTWSQPYYFHMAPDITPNGNLNICNNTGITLTTPIITPPSPANVAYQWFKVNTGGSDISVGTNTNTYFVSTSGNYYVKLIYNGTTICPGNDTTYASQYDSINVGYIPPSPTLGTNSPIFQGSNLLLSASSPGTGNIDYFWTGPNGFASNSQNPTITSAGTNAAGIYSCYLINNGCISDIATIQVFIALPTHTTYKYWFDTQYDNSLSADMGTGNDLTLQQNIPTNQLAFGLHVFNIKFMDKDGKWSSISSSFFYKPQEILSPPAQYEYWFDNDYTNKSTSNISNTSNLILSDNLTVNNLAGGLHTFNIRFKPDGKKWTSVTSSFFYKIPTPLAGTPKYQYWFDDKLQDSVTTVIGSTNNLILLDSLMNSQPVGLHTLNIRFKPNGGLWSSVVTSFFYKNQQTAIVNNTITQCVYWYDNNWQDPRVVYYGGQSNLSSIINTDAEELSIGTHSVSMMFKDDKGSWSSVTSNNFNRVAITSPVCPFNDKQFISRIFLSNTANRQWQVNTGAGFVNIANNSNYSGSNSDTLQITGAPTSWYGYQYRCVLTEGATTVTSEVFTLKFYMVWYGSTDKAWENPANWNCTTLPDANTDVIIYPGVTRFPEINTSATCRSLTAKPGVNVTVKTGASFLIAH